MKKINKKLFMMACLTTSLVLQGCSSVPLITNDELRNLTDGNVVRATVDWTEKADEAYSPASYNVEANRHNWVKEDLQYRWIPVKAILRRDKWGSVLRTARIADGVPLLKTGDWVDVYMAPFDSTDYSTLQTPVILRLVCAKEDSACKDRAEKELGGKNEVVQKGMPEMSNYRFSKVFDADGKRLK